MSHARKHRSRRPSDDLHGNAPDESRVVLLLIDVINDLSFPGNKDLVRRSVELAKSIAKLKKRCKKSGIPAIYVNDNRGQWRSDICAVLRHCLRAQSPGREMTKLLVPEADDCASQHGNVVSRENGHAPFPELPLPDCFVPIRELPITVEKIDLDFHLNLLQTDVLFNQWSYRLFLPFVFGARSGSFKPLLDSSHSLTSTPCFFSFDLFASK